MPASHEERAESNPKIIISAKIGGTNHDSEACSLHSQAKGNTKVTKISHFMKCVNILIVVLDYKCLMA
jgi:hypothetical protein